MNDNAIETEIQAKGKTAPRVTPGDIEAVIRREFYFTGDAVLLEGIHSNLVGGPQISNHEDVANLSLLTFCVLVLRNGFTVTGESACASPENFDAEIGRKIARHNAVAKIWPLMGYELKSRLTTQAA
jgi:hypothetical protein